MAHSNLQACKHPDCPRVAPVGKMLCEPHFKKVRDAFFLVARDSFSQVHLKF